MKLLYVVQRYYPYIGGAEQVMQVTAERFARAGHASTVYTTEAWDLERLWRSDRRAVELENETHNEVYIQRFPISYLPASRWMFPALKRMMSMLAGLPFDTQRWLFAIARRTPHLPALDDALDHTNEHFDLVHTANISLDSAVYAAYRYARRKRVPFVITPFVHLGENDDPRVVRYYTLPHQVEMMANADAVIVMTGREADALVARGVPRGKLHRIGAGVEPKTTSGGNGARFRAKHGITHPIVAYVGTAAFDKGTAHLIDAVGRLNYTHPVTLVLAGSQMSDFERYFTALPTDARAHVLNLGFISEAEKQDLLAACDVFAMPSRTDSFGIVYLEAWLYFKPVIGANAGGVPEVITDGHDGITIKFGDVDALAQAILKLLNDPLLAQRLGIHGHAKVLREMTWERQWEQVRRLYETLVQSAER